MIGFSTVDVKVKKITGFVDVPLPKYATPGSSAMDLHACIDLPVTLYPGERTLISAGIAIQVPEGYEAQVRPRSGLALKHGLSLVNSPGTIDSDYRGEIGVIIINHSDKNKYVINRGDRIAQMAIVPVIKANWKLEELDYTSRGEGGYGHTGS